MVAEPIVMPVFVAALVLALPLQTGTIEDVNVVKSFAGRLGSRITTTLSVRTAGGLQTLRVRDCRHSKFHHGPSPLRVGDKIAFPDRAEAAAGDIKVIH